MSDLFKTPQQKANTAPAVSNPVATMMSGGMAMLDMMLKVQRASLQSFSSYSPSTATQVTGTLPPRSISAEVVPLGEERLNVATRVVQGETTRVRRRVVEQQVEQDVLLRDEKVVIERRPRAVSAGTGPDVHVLTETVVEMSDSTQIPTVWKSVHVGEEVVLRRHVVERTERVRETLRRDVVDVEIDGPQEVALLQPAEAQTIVGSTKTPETPDETLQHLAKIASVANRANAQADELQRAEAKSEAAKRRIEEGIASAKMQADAQADVLKQHTEADASQKRADAEAVRKLTGQDAEAQAPGPRKG